MFFIYIIWMLVHRLIIQAMYFCNYAMDTKKISDIDLRSQCTEANFVHLCFSKYDKNVPVQVASKQIRLYMCNPDPELRGNNWNNTSIQLHRYHYNKCALLPHYKSVFWSSRDTLSICYCWWTKECPLRIFYKIARFPYSSRPSYVSLSILFTSKQDLSRTMGWVSAFVVRVECDRKRLRVDVFVCHRHIQRITLVGHNLCVTYNIVAKIMPHALAIICA